MVLSEKLDNFSISGDSKQSQFLSASDGDKFADGNNENEAEVGGDISSSLSSLPTPPDGGWGWLVCFSSFMCNVIIDGFMFSFGVFFIELLDEFKESKGKTAWAGSILMGMSMFTGPFTSSLVNMFGTRAVTIFGAVFAGISFACSTLSPNVDVMILLYGVFGGIGVNFIFIAAVLSVGFYFEKRRAFANGIAACGAGVGIFSFAQLSRFLLDIYTWRGALLIISGLVLNCAVFGALFRPLRKPRSKTLPQNSSSDKLLPAENEQQPEDDTETDKFQENLIVKNGKITTDLKSFIQENKTDSSFYAASMPNIKPVLQLKLSSSDRNLQEGKNISRNMHMRRGEMQSYQDNQYVGSLNTLDMRSQRTRTVSCSASRGTRSKTSVISNPLYRKDAFYSGSISSLKEFRSNPDLRSYRRSVLSQTSASDLSVGFCSLKEALRFLHQMCDLSLLSNPVFVIIVLSCTLWTAQSIVMTYIGDYAMTQGLGKQKAAHLLAIIGITNIVGRAVIGWFCDRPFVDCVMVNMCSLLVAAGLNVAIPFITSFELLATVCAVYGLCMGTWVSVRPIVLVSLMGIDKLTNAFGWLSMFQGVGFIVGPPMAGFLYDYTQTYVFTFVCNGVIFAIAGLLCLPLRRLVAFLKKREIRKARAKFGDDP